MFDELYLGSVPCDENCVQVDPNTDYVPQMIAECKHYKELLEKKFPIPQNLEDNVYFKLKREEHEFGSYYEVTIRYNEELEEAVNFAFNVENNLPATWESLK